MKTKSHTSNSSAKLRIAHFFSADPASAGGVQEHVRAVVVEMLRRGHQVDVYGPDAENKYEIPHFYPSCSRVATPMPNGNWGDLTFPNHQTPQLIQKLQEGAYDLCHVHSPQIPFVAWRILRKSSVPVVTTFHTGWDDDSTLAHLTPFFGYFSSLFNSFVAGTIFISSYAEKTFHTLCEVNSHQQVILNGVDTTFQPKPKEALTAKKSKIKLLFLGRIVTRKGLHHLFKALSYIPEVWNQIEVIVVGDGADLERCKKISQELGLSKMVTFKGEVLGDKRVSFFQEADIFCAPYVDEGLGLTLLEAVGCGCTVVGYHNEAFIETVGVYPAAELMVESRNIQALAKALKKAITQPKLRQKVYDWAVETRSSLSWEYTVDQTLAFYHHLLNLV
jgi:phosphatidylinositol alpha-mannosyltransferase